MVLLISIRSNTILRSTSKQLSLIHHHHHHHYYSTSTSTISSTTTTASSDAPKNTLVILGGGLSGLSSAYYFLKSSSNLIKQQTKIIILEKQNRTGGWCHSIPQTINSNQQDKLTIEGLKESSKNEVIDGLNSNNKSLVFESGPRSIRPVGLQGWLTVEMAHTIGLTPLILTVPKTAPSAKNRYVYYPDHLTMLPSSLLGALKALITTPLLRSTLPGILSEPFRFRSKLHKESNGGDESVDAFFKRRFGKPLAENMISAMIHGIYSGDTRHLSVRAIFPGLWEAEREWRSIILFALFGNLWKKLGGKSSPYALKNQLEEKEMGEIKERLKGMEGGTNLIERMEVASVWGVKGGLEKLTDTLRDWLMKEGVEIRMGDAGTLDLVEQEGSNWKIKTSTSTLHATHLISTLPSLLPSSLAPPTVPSSTVSVLNLAFPPTSPPIFPPGFGYLIPRSVKRTKNPHRALGVIFDSDVMPLVDDMNPTPILTTTSSPSTTTTSTITNKNTSEIPSNEDKLIKISILSGGSYWLKPNGGPPSPLPSHSTLLSQGLTTLSLHFPYPQIIPKPIHSLSHTHTNCITQCPPYHFENMRTLGSKLRECGGIVAVVGGEGVSGVGVNGAVKGAWEVGSSFGKVLSGGGEMKGEKIKTGTEMWE